MALVHTAEQAAEIIGGNCKPSWLKEKARLRQIPFTMLGSGYGWTDAQIGRILDQLAVEPQPAATKRRAAPRKTAAPVPATPVVLLTASTLRPRKKVA